MRAIHYSVFCAIVLFFTVGCGKPPEPIFTQADLPEDGVFAELITSRGSMLAQLHVKRAPLTVTHFVALAEGTRELQIVPPGVPFYDGLIFHQVKPGFVVQTGDPLGTGTGSTGDHFPDELHPDLQHDATGVLSMANAMEADTNSSQFMIMLQAQPGLNRSNAAFGKVIRGLEILPTIQLGDQLERVVIFRKGAEAEAFRPTESTFQQAKAAFIKARKGRVQVKITSQWPNAVKQPGGHFVETLQEGKGSAPTSGQTAKIHYKIQIGEVVIDNSHEREKKLGDKALLAVPLGAGKVAPWTEAVLSAMKPGGHCRVLLPYELAGEPKPQGLHPEHVQIWEIELVSVATTANPPAPAAQDTAPVPDKPAAPAE